MIKTVTVTNYVGDSLTMKLSNPYESGLVITNIDGIASLDATINTTEVATNDGSIYNSARTNSRNIVMSLKPLGNDDMTVSEARLLIYKFFPVKKKLNLRFLTDEREVEIDGYVESSETEVFSEFETTSISILCPDPYFEDVNAEIMTFSGVNPMFEFPFGGNDTAIPDSSSMVLSELFNDTIRQIYYVGDVETGMEIDIHAIGPASDIVVYNLDTNETMGISGEILTHDDIVISTVRNKKTARLMRDGVYTNILNKLARDSDWFELQKGLNTIAYQAESGTENLQFVVKTKVLYEGI